METPTYFDERGNVICQLCNKAFTAITPTHLKKSHGIKFNTYRSQFPDAPITGDKFSKTMKYVKTDFFKKDDDLDTIPKIENILGENFEEKLKEFSNYKQPRKFICNVGNTPKSKVDIINFLMIYFDEIENNFFVEKYTLSGHLDYRFVTDIVDLKTKINFEFPNAFWHNRDVAKAHRDLKLKSNGWTIIDILSKSPTVSDVEEELKKRHLI